MPPLTIALLRRLVRSRRYLVSVHAADELEDDGLSILDLENIVLTGQIVERQRDRSTRELKVVIRGQALHGSACCAVAKVGPAGRGYHHYGLCRRLGLKRASTAGVLGFKRSS